MASSGENVCTRRKALKTAVGALCCEPGFSYAENTVLETLTEMIQSYIFEVGRSARAFSELSGRAEPMLSDVAMALIEMGLRIEEIPEYARRKTKITITPPAPSVPLPAPKTLPVGEKQAHPSHIPSHLPPFPDPHTYIKTLTTREQESEYQILREKAATQKRDVERALTRFIAKTGETESLFADDPYAFPLIANKPKPLPYLDALLPMEQDLESSEEPPSKKKAQEATRAAEELKEARRKQEESQAANADNSANVTGAEGAAIAGTSGTENTSTTSETNIDNPYLRAIIMPKIGRTVAKKTIAATTSAFKW